MTSSNESPEVLSSDSSSNSSSLTSQWSYDVFLSFRGEDTRYGFISHLYSALHQKGINTYMDDKLRRGEEISPTLLKAIKESKISIVVFSENYASSIWCLNELIRILECKESKQQKVLPVFYKVEPSTVRLQKNSFKEALAKHEDRFKDDAKVQRWKTALKQAADISGLHLKINEDESKFIQKILQEVSKIVLDRTYLHVAEYPVGIDSRVEDINKLLCIKENETCMIGIFGIGGIGKTTIAKEMYNRITDQFEGSCFLANVRESSKQDQGGLVKLQEKILDDILKDSNLKVDNVDRGINLIMERLCGKRILLVIDDVDSLDQLEKLCGRCDWFGSGSRIIITTRNAGLLNKHCVSFKFRMKEMDHGEALKLFSKQAFKSGKPDDGFAELTKLALYYAGGLPLALKVVGSNLYGEDIHYWKSELEKYKRIPEENIQEKLKISYDGLNYYERKIFLDIAYFFKGDKREYVTKILDGCGFFPNDGIKKLNDKCLITIDQYDRLWMHDLLQDMGREIVRQESPEEPGKRSRLYFHEDVHEVLEKNKGTEQIEGILIDLPREDCKTQMSTKALAKLKNLRIFINRSASFSDRLKYFSNELRVLDWLECPLEFLPSTLHGEKLTVLKMQGSMIRDLGTRVLYKNLTSIDFSESKYLTKISDLSSCSNLEKLILNDCESLVEVHDSVGFLDKLVELNFLECSSLKNLPRSFKLRSLKLFELRGCTSLEYFPEIECKMEHLKHLYLESTVIKELSSSITYLIGLEQFFLRWCESLEYLPINIFQLERLMVVHIQDCPIFVNFGKEVGQNGQSMPCTQELLPLSPPKSNFSLCTLILSGSGIVSLPPWIEGLVGLSRLDLAGCEQLEKILQLPPSIEVVNAPRCIRLVEVHDSVGFLDKLVQLDFTNCSSLKKLPRSFKLRSLKVLRLEGCTSLEYFPEIKSEMEHLKCVRLHSIVIQELPSSITYLTGLKELYLKGCKSLVRLPINIFELKSLWAVNIINCPNLVNFGKEVGQNGQSMPCTQKNEISSGKELFPLPPPESNNLSRTYNFSSSLRKLSLSGSGIVSLPPCIKAFVGLSHLDLRGCKQLEEIIHLPPNIEEVEAFGCGLLEHFHHASFGMPNLKRLTKVDLSECNKVKVDVGNQAPDPFLVKERFRWKDSSRIIYPGSRIPKWFKYCKETTSYSNSIEIEIDHNEFTRRIVALVLCFVPVAISYITISIDGQQIRNDMWLRPSMDTHCVCLQYIAGNHIDQMLSRSYRKGNNIRFTFGSDLKEAIFKSAGVHLIYIDPAFQKMLKRKEALKKVVHISGFSSAKFRNKSECIVKSFQEVSSKLPNRTCLHVAKYAVGLKSRVEDIYMFLRIEIINETRMIGVFGTGGIGKTTIAKEVYNRIADQFEGGCFLAEVRENSKPDKGGLIQLQEKILSDILRYPKVEVDDVDRGINMIQKKLHCKKVLLVLDDIDCLDQLEKLSGRCDWFGLGSRIIITTRDEHLLDKHHVHFKYRMKEMDHDEALQLFSQHAFKSDKPDDAFVDVIKLALKCAGGLPLALQVIGSNLYEKDIRFWKSELKKYKSIQEENIHKKLKISYDGLDDPTKKIFLDIACFFKGHKREYVTKILDNCGFFAYAGINNLNDKCLITIDEHDQLMMHDLLEDMGREIVRQESPEEPGKRSRLYFHEDVREVLEENKGTEQIEGILINQHWNLPWLDCINNLRSEVFAKMERLKILIIRNVHFYGELNYLSNELRVLDWPDCHLEFLPSSFHGEKLIVFNIRGSNIRDVGTSLQSKNLTSIDLSDSHNLTNISDLSSCSNLEKLILGRCGSLVEVHDSVGFLNKLVELNFTSCSSLKKLPRSFKLRCLVLLELGGCTSLEYFPEIECEMEHLKHLWLESTVIQKLPSSITNLTGLDKLYLEGCKSLVHLPINIFQLESLKDVSVKYCPNFGKEVGHNGQSMPCTQENEISSSMELLSLPPLESNNLFNFSSSLRKLSLFDCGIVSLPPCIEGFVGLSKLKLRFCKQLEEILHLPPNIEDVNASGCSNLKNFLPESNNLSQTYNFSSSLKTLNLSGSSIVNLPPCIEGFVGLFKLNLTFCKQLEEILHLPPNIEVVDASGCSSLKNFLPESDNLSQTYNFSSSLRTLNLSCSGIVNLPSCIEGFVGLLELNLTFCKQLEEILHLPPNIEVVDASGCSSLKNFLPESDNLSQTYNFSSSLRTLNLSCSGIVNLPSCIEGFVGLLELNLTFCKQLEEILHLPPNIEVVDASGCSSLKNFLPESDNLSQTYNFSSSLRTLNLSCSGIVNLPPCIEGFVGLFELDLTFCKQLEGIL
ncbi:hypothetical protein F2P56_013446, partial [Juglans regia]